MKSGSKHTNGGAKRKHKVNASKLEKSTITCKCGAKILLVPDLKEMNLSLETHISEHKKKYGISDDEAETIIEDLIVQVFSKIVQ